MLLFRRLTFLLLIGATSLQAGGTGIAQTVLDDFESGPSGWKAGQNVSGVQTVQSFLNGPGQPYHGQYALELSGEAVPANQWRTVYKKYSAPLDLQATPLFIAALNTYGIQGANFEVRIEFFSGSEFFSKTEPIQANSWNQFAVDLSNWSFNTSIDSIAISFRATNESMNWAGKQQIDYIRARSTGGSPDQLVWLFKNDFDTEGWRANNSLTDVDIRGGSMNATLSGTGPVISNTNISMDASMIRYFSLHMKNKTQGPGGRIYWETETGSGFTQSRSIGFTIEPGSNYYGVYGIDLGTSQEWKGTVTGIRLALPEDAGVSKGNISLDEIRFSRYPEAVYYPGEITDVGGTNTEIRVEGTVQAASPTKLKLVELRPYETFDFNRPYSVLDSTTVQPSSGTASFNFTVDRLDGQRDRLYSKFVVLVDGAQPRTLAPAQYVGRYPSAEHNFENYIPPTKKGLQVQMTDDAQKLGIGWAAINYPISNLFYKNNSQPGNAITYYMDGNPYYIRKDYVEGMDHQIKNLSDNGINVFLIVLFIGQQMPADSPNQNIRHPDYEGGTIAAVNTTDSAGTNYWKAAMEFLADRYTREDQKYGRAASYIIGNEIDAASVWNDMGAKELSNYIEQYSRTLRIAYTAARKKYAYARVYDSMTHFWTEFNGNDPWRSYPGKDIIDQINYHIKREGDIPWNIAYHPYPENLFDPAFWNDQATTDSYNTRQITFKNLHVLPEYMSQPDYLYKGKKRNIALTEQGFHTPDQGMDSQKLQAAAYAYAYYKVKFLDDIEAFIYHRHVDHELEGGLNLGLWFRDENAQFPAKPGEPKLIYEVFKKIDTKQSLEVSEFAKSIIGIQDWESAIPGFNPQVLTDRELPKNDTLYTGTAIQPEQFHSDFEEGTDGWEISEYSTVLSTVASAEGKTPFKGSGMLRVQFAKGEGVGGAKAESGVVHMYDQPVDVSNSPILQLAVNPPGGLPGTRNYEMTVRVYSSDFNLAQGTASVTPDRWNTLSLDLNDWENRSRVSKVKIWFHTDTGTNWSGSIYLDEIGWKGGSIDTGNPADSLQKPVKTELLPNYPNPFFEATNITFGLPREERVTIAIYNLLGRKVSTLVSNKSYPEGYHTLQWRSSSAASGLYFYRLETPDKNLTRKMLLVK